ncbi:MAG TPA: peptidylprolyl isomerase [Kofleriaceae bacterium]|nr:peptidylprolyl isomerase [Kofleriaceae bacterium]
MRKLAFWLALTASAVAAADPPSEGSGSDSGDAKTPAPESRNAGKHVALERVVAVVNDAIILESELDARLVPLRAEAQQIADPAERKRRIAKLASQVLDEMVNEELIVQAAEQAKIEVDTSEVQAALDEIKQNNKLDDTGLAQALAAQGFTLQSYKADLKRQLLRLRAVNQLVAPKVQVTEEDVHARYDELQRRSAAVSAVRLSHILIKVPDHPTEQQLDAAKEAAAQAIARVKNGEDFAEVAKQVSQDPSTAPNGGELGWFERGSIANPDWEPIVFAMQKGDVRGPVSGSDGLHVFYANEIKSSQLKPYAEMKDQLQRELRRRELDKATQTWVDELRKKAYIDIKLQ